MTWLSAYAPLPLRLAVGGVFLRHGITKLQTGLPGVSDFLHGLGFPFATVWAVLLIGMETVGAACVIAGLLTRIWAIGYAIEMVVVILFVSIPGGRAFELEALLLAGALSLIALGDGPVALGSMRKKS